MINSMLFDFNNRIVMKIKSKNQYHNINLLFLILIFLKNFKYYFFIIIYIIIIIIIY